MSNGILVVNKSEGLSSAKVVAKVKHLLRVKKVGHTGTLDPFASGVLVCCINQATRVSQFFLNGDKHYRATIRLGIQTDSYDLTGSVIESVSDDIVLSLDHAMVKAVVDGFHGKQDQVPPSFSALKQDGQPLYKLARKGIKVKKPARAIEIYMIEVTRIDLPFLEIDVHCSSGTYIRSIAHDIGAKLGCGGHLTTLCRTRSSQFSLADSVSLEKIDRAEAEKRIIPLSDTLPFLPYIEVSSKCCQKIVHGQRLSLDELSVGQDAFDDGTFIRLIDTDGNLRAIVQFDKIRQSYNYSCVFSA